MTDDITCRLNVNSVSQVYSASLPVVKLYVILPKKSMVLKKIHKNVNINKKSKKIVILLQISKAALKCCAIKFKQ